jgi:hypothetical protein
VVSFAFGLDHVRLEVCGCEKSEGWADHVGC